MTPTDTDRRLAEILGRLQATPPRVTLERHGDGFAFFSMRGQPIVHTRPAGHCNEQHGYQIAYGGVYDSRMWPPLRDLLANAQDDIAFLLSLVEGLSRELLVAKAPSVIRGALADVIAERAAQDRKWGEQNHRDACPALLDRDGGVSAQRLADDLEIPSAARARANCQAEFARGQGNWASILVEEVAEAVAAIGEDADLRRELVQVSAVSLAWIEAIDRRSVGAPLVAASGASSAEGSIPSLPCPSPLSSPTPPAPEAAPVPDLSSGATGSEGDHGLMWWEGRGLTRCPRCLIGFVGVP